MMSVLMPSRGRPKWFRECVESILDLAEEPVEILAYVDTDDEVLEEYAELDGVLKHTNVVYGPQQWYVPANKILLPHARGEWIFFCSDDHLVKTKGWDVRLKAHLPDGMGVVYPKDHPERPSSTTPITTKKWLDLCGPWPTRFQRHFGLDTWLVDIARRAGRLRWAEDVLILHKKKRYGYDMDATHYRIREGNEQHEMRIWIDQTSPDRQAIADRIKLALSAPAGD